MSDMTTHVALQAHEAIYDGHGLRKEIYDWLIDNVGRRANDMTQLLWSRRAWLFEVTRSHYNPKYFTSSSRSAIEADAYALPKYLHFQFSNPDHAVMFKLVWGGK